MPYDPTDELLPPYNRLNTPTFSELAAARRGDGFARLGSALGGTLFGGGQRELRDQQIQAQAATGVARMQDILLQARQRRDAEIGRQAAAAEAEKSGDTALANLYLQGKVNPQELVNYRLGTQKFGNIGEAMTLAQQPNPDLNALNRRLMVIAGKPVDLTKVEGQNIVNPIVTPDAQTVSPTDIGTAMIGTQKASAAQHYAGAGAANALRDLRAGPMSEAARSLAAERDTKAGETPGVPARKPSKLTVPEMTTALGTEPNDRGVRHIDPAKLRQFNTLQQGMIEAGDPNATNAQYVLQQFEGAYGNNPEDVPPDTLDIPAELQAGFDYAAKHGGRVPQAAPPAAAAVAQPKTRKEFDALPSGSLYIDPGDGTKRRKP